MARGPDLSPLPIFPTLRTFLRHPGLVSLFCSLVQYASPNWARGNVGFFFCGYQSACGMSPTRLVRLGRDLTHCCCFLTRVSPLAHFSQGSGPRATNSLCMSPKKAPKGILYNITQIGLFPDWIIPKLSITQLGYSPIWVSPKFGII